MTVLEWTLTYGHRELSFGFCNGNSPVTEKQMREKWRPLSK